MKLIGILGYAQVGKDTVGRELAKNLNHLENINVEREFFLRWKGAQFSMPIKRLISRIVRLDFEYVCTAKFKLQYFPEFNMTGREMLQKLGVGMREMFGKDVWVRMVQDALSGSTIITDVRFLNEAEWIKSKGGIIIKKLPPPGYVPLEHESEKYIDSIPYDYEVPYFEKLEDLNVHVSHLAYEIFKQINK